jgi:aldehyde:ferredoxin oxidoreductase
MSGFVCSFMTEPTAGAECREYIWSEGKACKKCPAKCHRAGMTKKQAIEDNARLRSARNEQGKGR